MKLTLTPEDRQKFEAQLGRRLPPPDTQAFEDLLVELEQTDPAVATELRDAIRVIGVPSALHVQGAKAKEEAKFTQLVKKLFYKQTPDGFVQDKSKITRTAVVSVAVLLLVGAFGAILKPAASSGLSLAAIAGGGGVDPANPKTATKPAVGAKPVSRLTGSSSQALDFPSPSKPTAQSAAGQSGAANSNSSPSAPETVNYDVPSTPPASSPDPYISNGVNPRSLGTRPGSNSNTVIGGAARGAAPTNTRGAAPIKTMSGVVVVNTRSRITAPVGAAATQNTASRSSKLQMGASSSASVPGRVTGSSMRLSVLVSAAAPSSNAAPAPLPAAGMSVQNTPTSSSRLPATAPTSKMANLALQGAPSGSSAPLTMSDMSVQNNAASRTTGFSSSQGTAPAVPVSSASPGIALGGSTAAKPTSTPTQNDTYPEVNSGFPVPSSAPFTSPSPTGAAQTTLPGAEGLPALESALPVTVGMRLEARLVISVVAVEQGSAPIVAVTENPPCGKESCPPLLWIGQALLGPDRRIWVSFTQATMDGKTYRVSGQALERTALRPGLPAQISDEAPALVSDLLRGAIGGFSDLLGAQLGQRTTTVIPGGGAQSSGAVPDLTNFFLGRLSGLFSIPADSKALVRVARVPIDTTFTVLYGIPLALSR